MRRGAWLLLALPILLSLVKGFEAAPAFGKKTGRPNVVLIQVDDLSMRVMNAGIRGPNGIRPAMPKTRALLADRGTTFSRFYSNSPICGPSRASLLSGLSVHNHGMLINAFPFGYNAWAGTPRETSNLATWMDRLGYRTAHIGKFMNGYGPQSPVPPGWDTWITAANNYGAPYYGHSVNMNGQVIGPIGSWASPDAPDCGQWVPTSPGACTHANDVHTAFAIEEIGEASRSRTPFYLQLDLNAPHDDGWGSPGPEPPARYRHLVPRVKVDLDLDDRAGNGKKPYFVRDLPALTSDLRWRVRKRFQKEVVMMRAVDDSVGQIVATLRNNGRLNNTFIVFMSDNGMFQGEHRIAYGKYLPHEPATRQPLIIRGPGIPAGSKTRMLASTVDIAPTLMSMVGGRPGSRVDGSSLKRFAENPRIRSDRAVLLEGFNGMALNYPGPFFDGIGRNEPNQALVLNYTGFVSGRWKYVRYYYGDEELYDLARDPNEHWNLARSKDFLRVLRWSRKVSGDLAGCSGPACRIKVAPPGR